MTNNEPKKTYNTMNIPINKRKSINELSGSRMENTNHIKIWAKVIREPHTLIHF